MKIFGIGNDLVEIVRIRTLHQRRGERFLNKIFVRSEIDYCLAKSDPAPHLAARFAAKEAFAKALGTGIGAHARWTEIIVTREDAKRPSIVLTGSAKASAERLGIREVHLALSHSHGHALANVIAVAAE